MRNKLKTWHLSTRLGYVTVIKATSGYWAKPVLTKNGIALSMGKLTILYTLPKKGS